MSRRPPNRTVYVNNHRKGMQIAKDFAKVPRVSRGGQPIYAREINPTSRGRNYNNMLSQQSCNGRNGYMGMRNPYGVNYYEIHPDGHLNLPGQQHHNFAHIHATNPKGEKLTVIYGNQIRPVSQSSVNLRPPKIKINPVRCAAKSCVVLGIGASLCNVANAAPGERKRVLANEISSTAGSFIGTAACAAIGTAICPGIGTIIGSIVGGFVGGMVGDAVAPVNSHDSELDYLFEK